jgi:ABC-type methionine transport system permease subunit
MTNTGRRPDGVLGWGILAMKPWALAACPRWAATVPPPVETAPGVRPRGEIVAVTAIPSRSRHRASRMKVLIYDVRPQILPRIVGLTVYTWGITLRQSTIIGRVGAGGIGPRSTTRSRGTTTTSRSPSWS